MYQYASQYVRMVQLIGTLVGWDFYCTFPISHHRLLFA